MNTESNTPDLPGDAPSPHRLFLHEPGWQVGLKLGSMREFCYVMAPGQDYYHRLLDGEIYLSNGEERLCVACAERRGLLSTERKPLREALVSLEYDPADAGAEFELKEPNEPLGPR